MIHDNYLLELPISLREKDSFLDKHFLIVYGFVVIFITIYT